MFIMRKKELLKKFQTAEEEINALKSENEILTEQLEHANILLSHKSNKISELECSNEEIRKELLKIKNNYFNALNTELKNKTQELQLRINALEQAHSIFENQRFSSLKILKKAASQNLDIYQILNSIRNGRLNNSFDTNLYVKKLEIKAEIGSENHYYKNVTFTSCSCPDFEKNHQPCKHMIFLIYSLGILQLYRDECFKRDLWIQDICTLQSQKKDLEEKIKRAKNTKKKLEQQLKAYEKAISQATEQFDKIAQKKCASYPQLAGMVSDYKTLFYAQAAQYLKVKKHPAPAEALRINDLRIEAKRIEEEKSILEYKLGYIYKLYPEINQIFDDAFDYKNKPKLDE